MKTTLVTLVLLVASTSSALAQTAPAPVSQPPAAAPVTALDGDPAAPPAAAPAAPSAAPAPVAPAPVAPAARSAPQPPPASPPLAFASSPAPIAVSRLKDVASLQGPTTVPVVGYGLVVGLNKTGDRKQTIFSAQTLANMLERFGVAVAPGGIKIENVAAVLVTAEVGPYAQTGSRLDVTASSIGDARSLQGGTLLPTPLRGPDGTLVALAQGPLSIGGFSAGGGGNSVAVNHLTVGRVPGGALVQVARQTALQPADELRFTLYQPDFTSAGRVARAINMELGANSARVSDAGTIVVQVPGEYKESLPDLVARIEPLSIAIDSTARVVINERTGTVVLGGDVQIGPAAVAHGNLSVRIATQYQVSQPQGFSRGQTVVTPQAQVDVEQEDRKLISLESGTTLSDVVKALNTLGVTPRDIIAIMQALKAAGALRAEVVVL